MSNHSFHLNHFYDEDHGRDVVKHLLWMSDVDPPIFDIAFLGKEIMVYLVEEWHRCCRFRLDRSCDVAELFQAGAKLWSLPGIDFAQHIRRLEIQPQRKDYPRVQFSEGSIEPNPSDTGLPRNFDQISKLKRLATVDVRIDHRAWLRSPDNDTWLSRPLGLEVGSIEEIQMHEKQERESEEEVNWDEGVFCFDELSNEFFPMLKHLINSGVKVSAYVPNQGMLGRDVGLEHLDPESWSTLVMRLIQHK
jgi:hypothetical protein